MKELLYIFFYLIYGIEWVINRFKYDSHKSYRNIKFEVEAYKYQGDPQYLMNRKHYAQWRKSKDPE